MQEGKIRDLVDIGGIQVYCRYDEAVDIDRVTGHPRNPNTHSEGQIALLAKIIRHSGWRNPICVSRRSGFVIRGHGRLMAARVLGVTHVPVEYQDYESEAAEYNDLIADNRIAELAQRDMTIIKDLLEELDTGANDMDLTGYAETEIERLMTQFHVEENEAADEGDEVGVPDADPNIQIRISVPASVWLGKRDEIKGVVERMEKIYLATVRIEE